MQEEKNVSAPQPETAQQLRLFPKPGLRLLPLPRDGTPGSVQLPFLLLPPLRAGPRLRREFQVSARRREGLLRLSGAPCPGKLCPHHRVL